MSGPPQNAPPEVDGNAPAVKTSLLDLSNELLAHIGNLAAPLGGSTAVALRETGSRRLAQVLAPAVWKSIAFPLDPIRREVLYNILAEMEPGQLAIITSVRLELEMPLDFLATNLVLRQLPNIERLHVVGRNTSLPRQVVQAIDRLGSLRVLHLENVHIEDAPEVSGWVPRVRTLVLDGCRRGEVFFFRDFIKNFTALEAVRFIVRPRGHAQYSQTMAVAVVLEKCLPIVQHISIDWPEAQYEDLALPHWWKEDRTSPVSLELTGLPGIFGPAGTYRGRIESPMRGLAFFLRHIGGGDGPLTRLTLPFADQFIITDASKPILQNLRMDKLESLSLVRDPKALPSTVDILSLDAYNSLIWLLQTMLAPCLTSLRLKGWFDCTNVATIVPVSPVQLPVTQVYLVGLLAFLRGTSILKLRLEDTKDENQGCVFEREAGGDVWTSRLVWCS